MSFDGRLAIGRGARPFLRRADAWRSGQGGPILGRMHQAFIALGSNLGKRQLALRTALRRLEEMPGTRLLAAAPFMANPAVDAPAGSPDFLNTVAQLETALAAPALFAHLLRIEQELGRRRDASVLPNAPRTMDLDLLLFDREVLASPDLVIPHPRMHLRRFVLVPLAQIAPEAWHPVAGKTIRELLAELGPGGPPVRAAADAGPCSSDQRGTM